LADAGSRLAPTRLSFPTPIAIIQKVKVWVWVDVERCTRETGPVAEVITPWSLDGHWITGTSVDRRGLVGQRPF
jgi:hypothetical protein